jgi:hypothetical protein
VITPKWLYNTNGLERLEHAGRRSEAEICLACDEDGWRFGFSFRLHDKFMTYRGHITPPSPKDTPLHSRQEAISTAAEQINGMLRDRDAVKINPKAVAEVRTWLSRLSPPKTGQLALFGEAP